MARNRPGRTITLELLRAGPPHNQLLSPLTPYLAICGEAGAKVVHVPWEHASFERKLEDLRYDDGGFVDPSRRLALVQELGRGVAQLLGSIPALSGALSVDAGDGIREVAHLRLVLSASELSLIPYELSKTPTGLQMPADNWLLLQVQLPISLTRHIRSVPCDGVRWPEAARILFVAGDPEDLPFEQHRSALLEAVDPWLRPGQSKGKKRITGVSCKGELEVFGHKLTIVKDAHLEDVKTLCRAADYSLVHVLAHGGEDENTDFRSFGIGLNGEVVTGTRFASALTTTKDGGTSQPTIVSLASCDGANVGSVVRAGASFAHSLHQAGIPLVVASQFPLSFEGSETALRRMLIPSDGLLWGASHPVCMLHDVRRELLVENEPDSHDWASLVVYEALPPDLEEQLDGFQYRETKDALKTAEEHLDQVLATARDETTGKWLAEDKFEANLSKARERCKNARGELPEEGPYALEALGLRASNYKRNAEASFKIAKMHVVRDERFELYLNECHKDLERAFDDYSRATEGFLGRREERSQRMASLHWVVVQMLSMGTVLGREMNPDYWGVGRRSAKAYLQLSKTDERAWAHSSRAELALLRLANEESRSDERQKISREAISNITALAELYLERGACLVELTEKQFSRYRSWWGDPAFVDFLVGQGIKRRQDWNATHGVLDTADQISRILSEKLWRSGPPTRTTRGLSMGSNSQNEES